MRPSSITIKALDGKIYRITDLIAGNKIALTDRELKDYDMYPQSGVLKDINGNLIDITEIIGQGGSEGSCIKQVEFVNTLPEIPREETLYVSLSENKISYFTNGWNDIVSDIDTSNFIKKTNTLQTDEIQNMLTIFNN